MNFKRISYKHFLKNLVKKVYLFMCLWTHKTIDNLSFSRDFVVPNVVNKAQTRFALSRNLSLFNSSICGAIILSNRKTYAGKLVFVACDCTHIVWYFIEVSSLPMKASKSNIEHYLYNSNQILITSSLINILKL